MGRQRGDPESHFYCLDGQLETASGVPPQAWLNLSPFCPHHLVLLSNRWSIRRSRTSWGLSTRSKLLHLSCCYKPVYPRSYLHKCPSRSPPYQSYQWEPFRLTRSQRLYFLGSTGPQSSGFDSAWMPSDEPWKRHGSTSYAIKSRSRPPCKHHSLNCVKRAPICYYSRWSYWCERHSRFFC